MLQNKYGMLYNISNPNEAIKKASELAASPKKEEWTQKREQYYKQVGDINAQIVQLLTNI